MLEPVATEVIEVIMDSSRKPMATPIAGNACGLARTRARQRKRTVGVVMVEYAFLLVFFGVPVMLATASAGISLIKGYGAIRNDILTKGP